LQSVIAAPLSQPAASTPYSQQWREEAFIDDNTAAGELLTGGLEVIPAPEPVVWGLMLVGIAGLRATMRSIATPRKSYLGPCALRAAKSRDRTMTAGAHGHDYKGAAEPRPVRAFRRTTRAPRQE
jgi:hypothetical protein